MTAIKDALSCRTERPQMVSDRDSCKRRLDLFSVWSLRPSASCSIKVMDLIHRLMNRFVPSPLAWYLIYLLCTCVQNLIAGSLGLICSMTHHCDSAHDSYQYTENDTDPEK